MEIEELTKSQIVLLVLLVSFVTSIATGIVTVSLLAQAPPAITQTVNRIIERTVETVVPAENQTAATASVVTKETTVVVKEDDLITQSVADSFGKIVRIHEGTSTTSPILALGAVVGNGTIATDLAMVSGEHAVDVGSNTYRYVVSKKFPEAGVALLVASGTAPTIAPFKTIETSSLKLGQTLIGLFGARSDRVVMSLLSGSGELVAIGKGDDVFSVHAINTTIDSTLTPGTPIITIFGELAGISTSVSRTDSKGTFVAYSDIVALIAKVDAQAQASTTPTTP